MHNHISKSLIIGSMLLGPMSFAAELDIKVQNLTQGMYFTPLLISAHSDSMSLFHVGEAASSQLQAMAEGGDISGLDSMTSGAGANNVSNPASGMLAPGMMTMASLTTSSGNVHLSLVAMLLPTNDGFVGLDGWTIPTEAGTYVMYLNGYDAGPEANDELITGGGAPGVAGIPADPGGHGGTGGSGVTDMEETPVVHIHPGNIGDDMPSGGKSDLDNTVHRWLNPVAKVTVTVH